MAMITYDYAIHRYHFSVIPDYEIGHLLGSTVVVGSYTLLYSG
jgi:hypothetical protein